MRLDEKVKLAIIVPLCLFLFLACGEEEREREFGLCSDATIEEQDTMWRVYDAFLALGYELHCCVFFVRSPHQEVVNGVSWVELPIKYRLEARNAAEGWRGWYNDGVAYIRRYGEAEPYLESLLVHELAHSVGFQHGTKMNQFERRVKEQM
jgi:hypothetical protein